MVRLGSDSLQFSVKIDSLPLHIYIYNDNETGLFFCLTPSETLHFKGETCKEDKLSKERLVIFVASNMTSSEKNKLFIIEMSKTPTCFKNVKNLLVDYKSNKKA